jgi:hypothetical protein
MHACMHSYAHAWYFFYKWRDQGTHQCSGAVPVPTVLDPVAELPVIVLPHITAPWRAIDCAVALPCAAAICTGSACARARVC